MLHIFTEARSDLSRLVTSVISSLSFFIVSPLLDSPEPPVPALAPPALSLVVPTAATFGSVSLSTSFLSLVVDDCDWFFPPFPYFPFPPLPWEEVIDEVDPSPFPVDFPLPPAWGPAASFSYGHSFFRWSLALHSQHLSRASGRAAWPNLHCLACLQPSGVPQKRHGLTRSGFAFGGVVMPSFATRSFVGMVCKAFVDGLSVPPDPGVLWTKVSTSAWSNSWNWSSDSVVGRSSIWVSILKAETRNKACGCWGKIFDTTLSNALTCSIRSGSPAPSSIARALCLFQRRSPFAACIGSFATWTWVSSANKLDLSDHPPGW